MKKIISILLFSVLAMLFPHQSAGQGTNANNTLYTGQNTFSNRVYYRNDTLFILKSSTGDTAEVYMLNDSLTFNCLSCTGFKFIPPLPSGGGTPAGHNTWVQYNNNGSFGADTNFWFNPISKILSIGDVNSYLNYNGTTQEIILYSGGTQFKLNNSGMFTNGLIDVLSGGVVLGGNSIIIPLQFVGSSTGVVTFRCQAGAGTWNFNIPITAGSPGEFLTSQGGGSNAMTWTTAPTGTIVSATNISQFGPFKDTLNQKIELRGIYDKSNLIINNAGDSLGLAVDTSRSSNLSHIATQYYADSLKNALANNVWKIGGNTLTIPGIFGSLNDSVITFEQNSRERMSFRRDSSIIISGPNFTQIQGGNFIIRTLETALYSVATGTPPHIRFNGANNNDVNLSASDVAISSYNFKFPADSSQSFHSILADSSDGKTFWLPIDSIPVQPGGSYTQVQFNDTDFAGQHFLNGHPHFIFDPLTENFNVGDPNSTLSSSISINPSNQSVFFGSSSNSGIGNGVSIGLNWSGYNSTLPIDTFIEGGWFNGTRGKYAIGNSLITAPIRYFTIGIDHNGISDPFYFLNKNSDPVLMFDNGTLSAAYKMPLDSGQQNWVWTRGPNSAGINETHWAPASGGGGGQFVNLNNDSTAIINNSLGSVIVKNSIVQHSTFSSGASSDTVKDATIQNCTINWNGKTGCKIIGGVYQASTIKFLANNTVLTNNNASDSSNVEFSSSSSHTSFSHSDIKRDGGNTSINDCQFLNTIIDCNGHTNLSITNQKQTGLRGQSCPHNAEIYLVGDSVTFEGNSMITASETNAGSPTYFDSLGTGSKITYNYFVGSNTFDCNGFNHFTIEFTSFLLYSGGTVNADNCLISQCTFLTAGFLESFTAFRNSQIGTSSYVWGASTCDYSTLGTKAYADLTNGSLYRVSICDNTNFFPDRNYTGIKYCTDSIYFPDLQMGGDTVVTYENGKLFKNVISTTPFDSTHCYTKLKTDTVEACSPLDLNASSVNIEGDLNLKKDSFFISFNSHPVLRSFRVVSGLSVGADAMPSTTGQLNTAVGVFALAVGPSGMKNTGVGYSALSRVSTGHRNVAIGSSAGEEITTGVCNTHVGDEANDHGTTGSWNTSIGAYSGPIPSAVNYTIGIGYNAKTQFNNTIVIGTPQEVATPAAYSQTGFGTYAPRAKVHIRKDSTTQVALAVYGDTRDTGDVYITGSLHTDSIKTSGGVLNIPSSINIGGNDLQSVGKISFYDGYTTAGAGISAIIADGEKTFQSSDSVFLMGTPPLNSDQLLRISTFTYIQSLVTDILQIRYDYTDVYGNIHSGNVIPTTSGSNSITAGANDGYSMQPITIKAQASSMVYVYGILTTNIGSITYDLTGTIELLR